MYRKRQRKIETFEVDAYDRVDLASGANAMNHKTMGWVKAAALIMAHTIALGVMSFPSVFYRLGMFGGVLASIGFGLLSWQTGYVLIRFKVNHPGVMNFADAGHVIAGRPGYWLFGLMLTSKAIVIAGSHTLSGAIALNIISNHAICNVAWTAVVAFVSFVFTFPRSFERLSYICFLSVTSIIVACMITIIGTGLQDPSNLPHYDPADPVVWKAFENQGLFNSINAVTNIVFAYGGHVALFSFMAEMQTPSDFKYSLAVVQCVAITFYTLVGATVYTFGGQYTTSPALNMTSRTVRIIAFSIALISIVISGVITTYIGAKFIFLTLFRNSPRLTSTSFGTWGIWVAICSSIWMIGWLIAELIPFFPEMLSIISSTLTIWFTYGLSGVLWLYDHGSRGPQSVVYGGTGYFRGWKARCGFAASVFVVRHRGFISVDKI
ncbi:transmembrane amino acid transporter protein-domain-containing protein [Amylostereum chailletii]|nr:transmembrane amino acid transporter protein-domain-containing protein [Amylostereum chailletii]